MSAVAPAPARPAAAGWFGSNWFAGLGRNEMLFSLKAYAGAMLSLWLALQLDLQKPYWAMATAYIVAQPMAAAVTSKAVFRAFGTIIGATVAVVLVPNLVDAPELLCLALAVWVGGCLYVSLLDRSPRSYVAMLAGYTAAIIGFLGVAQPEAIFDTALSRSEEILVGIACSAVISRLILPRPLGPVLSQRLAAWMDDAGRWAGEVLTGVHPEGGAGRDRRRLAADTVDMMVLATHLPYDTSPARYEARQVRLLQQHLMSLLPILSGIEDRLAQLRSAGGEDPALHTLCADIAGWIAMRDGGDDPQGACLLAAIAARAGQCGAEQADGTRWPALLMLNLTERLRELVEVWANARRLSAAVAGNRLAVPPYRTALGRYGGEVTLHADHAMAALSGVAVAIGILATCALWILTGWHEGGGAAQMAAIFFSLFAFLDNPVPVMRTFTRLTVYAMVAAGLFQFTLLPWADGFAALAVFCAPFLLFFGMLMATPRHGPLGFLMCVNLPLVMMLDKRPAFDFAQFLNGSLASVTGLMVATLTAALFTTLTAEESVARLLKASWRDLARLCEAPRGVAPAALVRHLTDRFALIVQRLMLLPAGTAVAPEDVLRELRIGLNIADLKALSPLPGGAAGAALGALGPALARHFRTSRPFAPPEPGAAAALLGRIDAALVACIAADGSQATVAARALVGLRHGLFPAASAPDLPAGPAAVAANPAVQVRS